MRLLFLGDVVGRPGRRAVASVVRRLQAAEDLAFVVVNGENASGGKGIDPDTAEELFDAGIDVITSGNHIWQSKAILPYLDENGRLLRPGNYPRTVPGRGWVVRPARPTGVPVGVINLIGRAFMGPADCPFETAERALVEIDGQARVILVDMHAEATSEKVGMGRFLDGRVSLVVGSHTHVQTADDGVLPGGTAYVTDAGMCGPEDSVLGMRTDQVLRRFRTQMPVRFEVATGPVLVQGVLVDVDEGTGRATAIRRVRERIAS
jgi:2',3'-cyclic-nucleotide 2'-phosphodiesterase